MMMHALEWFWLWEPAICVLWKFTLQWAQINIAVANIVVADTNSNFLASVQKFFLTIQNNAHYHPHECHVGSVLRFRICFLLLFSCIFLLLYIKTNATCYIMLSESSQSKLSRRCVLLCIYPSIYLFNVKTYIQPLPLSIAHGLFCSESEKRGIPFGKVKRITNTLTICEARETEKMLMAVQLSRGMDYSFLFVEKQTREPFQWLYNKFCVTQSPLLIRIAGRSWEENAARTWWKMCKAEYL